MEHEDEISKHGRKKTEYARMEEEAERSKHVRKRAAWRKGALGHQIRLIFPHTPDRSPRHVGGVA